METSVPEQMAEAAVLVDSSYYVDAKYMADLNVPVIYDIHHSYRNRCVT